MNMAGNVSIDGNTITHDGEDVYNGEKPKVFKQTYTIKEDQIIDYYYRKVSGEWEQRHCIVYK